RYLLPSLSMSSYLSWHPIYSSPTSLLRNQLYCAINSTVQSILLWHHQLLCHHPRRRVIHQDVPRRISISYRVNFKLHKIYFLIASNYRNGSSACADDDRGDDDTEGTMTQRER